MEVLLADKTIALRDNPHCKALHRAYDELLDWLNAHHSNKKKQINMTQEEKQLLLKDLCARLPYDVKYCRDSWNYEWDQEMSVVEVLEDIDNEGYINYHKVYKVWDIKPYLRSMSSMTEDELIEIYKISGGIIEKDGWDFGSKSRGFGDGYEYVGIDDMSDILDWLNSHHFDYRGLIKKGLALEAPEGMCK